MLLTGTAVEVTPVGRLTILFYAEVCNVLGEDYSQLVRGEDQLSQPNRYTITPSKLLCFSLDRRLLARASLKAGSFKIALSKARLVATSSTGIAQELKHFEWRAFYPTKAYNFSNHRIIEGRYSISSV